MNANEVMQKVKQSMEIAMRQFIGQKVDNIQTKYAIKNTILGVLQNYYELGYIDTIPLVDLNHEAEINYLTNRIREIYFQLDTNYSEADEKEMVSLRVRLDELRNSLPIDERKLVVSLKDPVTFKPFVWEGTGYDH